ncbi:glycerol-3-phosphate responsive antiterminator [Clostridium sp.]|uniref:glycerol-3-phosphate responsive antiterminator n=1 Tax=Clostridium sp. TaxID=1506 RepID=UPI003994E06E
MLNFRRILEDNPIVAAVKDEEQLKEVLKTEVSVIFVLFGNILNIGHISESIDKSGKVGIIHIDLVEGLTNKEVSLRYLKENTEFKGIISTKPQSIKAAKKLGFYAIQRFFIIDSMSLKSTKLHLVEECDAIEILPGLLFKVIKDLSTEIKKPLIVGGLISDKEDVIEALNAGATCISTTKEKIWEM